MSNAVPATAARATKTIRRVSEYSLRLAVLLGLAFGSNVAASERDIRILAGPRPLDIDLNGDGIDDFIFATWTHSNRGYYSYSINLRDTRNQNRLHSVHVYHDGYELDSPGIQLLNSYQLPDCRTRAHFLIAPGDGGHAYELLTAYRLEHSYPPRPGRIAFVFHRLRELKPMSPAAYIFDGYRQIVSDQKHCDVVEAVRKELGVSGAAWHDRNEPGPPGKITDHVVTRAITR